MRTRTQNSTSHTLPSAVFRSCDVLLCLQLRMQILTMNQVLDILQENKGQVIDIQDLFHRYSLESICKIGTY
jgi:hypothetical protein